MCSYYEDSDVVVVDPSLDGYGYLYQKETPNRNLLVAMIDRAPRHWN